jgi:NADPH:quinone reductase-like Zn-dependent oxidoreductase/DNA-binding XRE family transcriptional regulator
MKAALIARYGSNDLVKVADTAVPVIGSMDLLVQVHAASVNPVDVKTRNGQLKTLLTYQFPLVLGNDLSDVVSDVGAQVTRFKKGDAVYARLDKDRIGTFAEFAVVREGAAALKPTNVTFEEAASFPLVALTAWQALVEIAKLGAHQRVLIHAGSGGVGSVAIQLARHLGATVFTTIGQRTVPTVDPHFIRETREALHMSRQVFAFKIGVNPRTLERWEQGRSRPNEQASALIRLVRKFPDTLERLESLSVPA